MEGTMISPNSIITSNYFTDSDFQNYECEMVLRNICLLQKNTNQENWTKFSFEDYKKFCKHEVSDSEKRILNVMVNGGKPILNTKVSIEAGWLKFENGYYEFTEKLIEMLERKFC